MLKYLSGVTTLRFDAGRCMGCLMCLTVCPHGVFAAAEDKVQVVDADACMECGACALNCPSGAIEVRSGVGCAAGIILTRLGRDGDCCGGSDCC